MVEITSEISNRSGPPTHTKAIRSVLHTDIAVSCTQKNQLIPIFEYLMGKEYKFEVDKEQSDKQTVYTLTVFDIYWADNVIELFTKLKELDFNE